MIIEKNLKWQLKNTIELGNIVKIVINYLEIIKILALD